ncbi:MAG: hypothetical protein GW949_09340 [Spirochaetales bacterium]|nr:hypothetical protein [Spirochaetales bacterium]
MTHSEAVTILFSSPPKVLTRTIIQKAFTQKVKAVHPDLNQQKQKTDPGTLIARIKEARDFLERSPWVSPINSHPQRPPATKQKTPRQTVVRPKPTEKHRWIPQRTLRFGQYLYYRGLVDWTSLIEGILAQRNSRPSFGTIARELGYLGEKQIVDIRRNLRPGEFFGSQALALGFLRPEQLQQILRSQARYSVPLGRIFVQRGVLTQEELYGYLRDFQNHNRSYPRDSWPRESK